MQTPPQVNFDHAASRTGAGAVPGPALAGNYTQFPSAYGAPSAAAAAAAAAGGAANPLPGNLASLSQIVARIPTSAALANPAEMPPSGAPLQQPHHPHQQHQSVTKLFISLA